MTDKIVVLITAGNTEEANRIARALVEQRLAACVNLVHPVQSVYRWEDDVTEDAEVLLVVKSSRSLFPEVRRAVESLHSYHVPEVICLPIIDGSPNYLAWLADSLKEADSDAIPFPAERKKMPGKDKAKPASGKKPGREKNKK